METTHPPFSAGDRVTHPEHGNGTVAVVTTASVEVEFDRDRATAGLWDATWLPIDEVVRQMRRLESPSGRRHPVKLQDSAD